MERTKSDFEIRKDEINTYFEFLSIASDEEHTSIKYLQDKINKEEKFSEKLQKIFIANGFLILYNLIEATVRNSIFEIYIDIKNNDVDFQKLAVNIKNLWIKKTITNFKEGNFRQDTLKQSIFDLTNQIIDKEIICFSEEDIDFSGNLDAKEIRKLADKFGFAYPKNGRNLEDIKNKRNRLAHGEYTFYDVGKDYTLDDLQKLKTEVFDYLEDVIRKIEIYINNKEYLLNGVNTI